MGKVTGIEWTDSTTNFWIGCHRVSPGCAKCYADTLVTNRMGKDFSKVWRTAPATFNAALKWKEPRHIFTCSLSDFFIEEADGWREDAWDIIRRTPQHTWMVLTKRPERMKGHMPGDWGSGWPNVWLGVSGEDYRHAVSRGAWLQEVPSRIRFLSAEPWLEQRQIPASEYYGLAQLFDWVIVGGESGPGARPMDISSARSLVMGFSRAKTAVFLKQLGGHPDKRSHEQAILAGRLWKEMPNAR